MDGILVYVSCCYLNERERNDTPITSLFKGHNLPPPSFIDYALAYTDQFYEQPSLPWSMPLHTTLNLLLKFKSRGLTSNIQLV